MNRKFLLLMSMFFIKLINNYFNKLYISQKINLFSQSFTAFSFRLEPKKPSIETLFEDCSRTDEDCVGTKVRKSSIILLVFYITKSA